jgi:flagellar motor switch protein FliM
VTLDRALSQEEIDSVFRNLRDSGPENDPAKNAQPYDFRRPDRIPKDQLRAIHLLHENFARELASSLSAYLRAYVIVNLVSVEQLSFMEFSQCLPSPTVMISLGMNPYDGNAVLEINPTLVFPILEMVLGGSGKGETHFNREITEIEQSILDGITRIILHDLRDSWRSVSQLAFSIEGHETEPQLLQILAPNEAVVAVSMEVRIGENVGMINVGVPSIIIKMLRHKFDQQWSLRKTDSTEREQARVLNLLQSARFHADGRLNGATLNVADFLQLKVGDVVALDLAIDRPIQLELNGRHRYDGQIVDTGRKRAFLVDKLTPPETCERKARRPLKAPVAVRS